MTRQSPWIDWNIAIGRSVTVVKPMVADRDDKLAPPPGVGGWVRPSCCCDYPGG